MMKVSSALIAVSLCLAGQGCSDHKAAASSPAPVSPVLVSQPLPNDSDDPAIWIHPQDPARSLVLGTDKSDSNGGLYVFDLQGKIIDSLCRKDLDRPNNVDVAYGILFAGKKTDIAVVTERGKNQLRVYSLPDMREIDGGGIPVFVNEAERAPMGVALYHHAAGDQVHAIVSRKSGPTEGYLEQILLADNGHGVIRGQLLRRFGKYSGKKEIESIAVDQSLGMVYYSDEQVGIRQYYADPAKGPQELALFGQGDLKEDNEGISIYALSDSSGYILVSDQGANYFNVYDRAGTRHPLLAKIAVKTLESDGSELSTRPLPGFQGGLFVAMSTDKTFHFYQWADLAKAAGLKSIGQ